MQNLSHRGINCSNFYPTCDKTIEIAVYALFHCDYAKVTWAHWPNIPFGKPLPQVSSK